MEKSVTHETPGKHDYFAEIQYKDGPLVRSSTVSVNYVGIEDMRLPTGTIDALIEKAGQTSVMRVDWWDRWDNEGVEKITIFEDGKARYSPKDSFLSSKQIVRPETAGTHTYQAEIVFEKGHTIKTNEVSVEFSGEVMDLPPTATLHYGKDSNSFMVGGGDIGDNAGIVRMVLLRDGVAVDSKEGAHLEGMLEGLISKAVPPADLGKHIYQAEVTDVGGHTARSEEIKLEFEKLEEAKAKGDSYKVVVDTEGEIADTSSDFFTPFYVLMGVLGAVVLGNGLVQLAKSIKAKSAKPSEEESPKEEEA